MSQQRRLIYPFAGRDVFDPVQAWAQLSAEYKDRFGAAALAHLAGALGSMNNLGPRNAFPAAEMEALNALTELAEMALPDIFGDWGAHVPRPELGAIGINSCMLCGCTQNRACDEGCAWSPAAGVCTECWHRLPALSDAVPNIGSIDEVRAFSAANPGTLLQFAKAPGVGDGLAFVFCRPIADDSHAPVVDHDEDDDGLDLDTDGEPAPQALPQIAHIGFQLMLEQVAELGFTGGPAFATWAHAETAPEDKDENHVR